MCLRFLGKLKMALFRVYACTGGLSVPQREKTKTQKNKI